MGAHQWTTGNMFHYSRTKNTMDNKLRVVEFAILVLVISPGRASQYCDKKNGEDVPECRTPKVILFWTDFFGRDDFHLDGFGQDPFIEAGCKVSNCRTTADKWESHKADAIIFHMRDIHAHTPLPRNRKPNQRYVFFLLEHPFNQWNNLRHWGGFFNLTMTYRLDSDIPLPYGRTEPLEAHVDASQTIEQQFDPIAKENLEDNRKLVAWFASNCNSDSKREIYVRELQKYIPVDIYGKCGPLECPEGNTVQDKRQHPDCLKMLERNYKFYLSFENIHCKGYVTEKLWHILNLDTVPIVMGGADYESIAPPMSVINVNDFKSPRLLAEYLQHLDHSPTEYWRYKAWRKTHRVLEIRPVYLAAFCHLCEILNDIHNDPDEKQKTYEDLHGWWGKDTDCDLHVVRRMRAFWP